MSITCIIGASAPQMPPWALSSKLLNLGSSLLTLPTTSDAFRRLAIFFGLFKFNSTGLYVFRCKQLNLEKLLYNQKKALQFSRS
jgi:hypothetical protein